MLPQSGISLKKSSHIKTFPLSEIILIRQVKSISTFLYKGFNPMWFYLMQIIFILRSIRTFTIKNLSRPSY